MKSREELSENEYDEKETLETFDSETQTRNTYDGRQTQYSASQLETTQSEAYNPHQDAKLVLEIRRSYANLRDDLNKNSRELVKADSNRLSNLIDQANAVFSNGII